MATSQFTGYLSRVVHYHFDFELALAVATCTP